MNVASGTGVAGQHGGGLRPAEHIRQEAGLEQEQQTQGELNQHGQQLGDGFQG